VAIRYSRTSTPSTRESRSRSSGLASTNARSIIESRPGLIPVSFARSNRVRSRSIRACFSLVAATAVPLNEESSNGKRSLTRASRAVSRPAEKNRISAAAGLGLGESLADSRFGNACLNNEETDRQFGRSQVFPLQK